MATPKLSAGAAFLKKQGLTPAQWKAKTSARWARNNPQPLFPSTDITGKEQSGLRQAARTQVQQDYAASPMPSLTTYLQPFADAATRTQAAGDAATAYLRSASANAQNLTGAFTGALAGGINTGQATVQGQGGSGLAGAIPPAAQSVIPAAALGSSYTQMLNAEQPAVGARVLEANQNINTQQGKAQADYQTAAAQRRQDIQDAIAKLYTSSLSTLQDQKNTGYKNAVTSYLALGKTAYQKAQAAERKREFGVTSSQTDRRLAQADERLAAEKSYRQATLDQKRTAAAAKGIDLAPAYKTLFVAGPSTTSSTGGKTGPAGQRGRWYTVTPTSYTATGTPIEGKAVRRFVAYGETVPTPEKNAQGQVTQKVTPGDYAYPKSSSSTTSRKATPDSWDRAVAQLKAKYPGQITASWLKKNFPPRPQGS
jgi:hypothetical protein